MRSPSLTRRAGRLCLAALAAMAGMSGCDVLTIAPLYGAPLYGPPIEQVTIHGTVRRDAGAAVQGIQIRCPQLNQTITTADDGTYALTVPMSIGQEVAIVATDIDGAENGGEFTTVSQVVQHPRIAQDTDVPLDFTLTLKP